MWERFITVRKDIGSWKDKDFDGVKAIFDSPIYSISLKRKIAEYILGHFEKMKEGAISVLENQLTRDKKATGIGTIVMETLTLIRAIDVLRPVMKFEEPEELSFNLRPPDPMPDPNDKVPNEILELTRLYKQVLLMGPPGVGKTYYAMWCSQRLTNSNTQGNWLIAQFHPSYRYEDFVERMVFESGPDGMVTKVKPMLFVRLCKIAEKNPEKQYVLILDEINRADIPNVFGELLYALEYRGKEVKLAYSARPLKVPDNLYIIATANSIDRGTFEIGVALRRRFKVRMMEPSLENLDKLLTHADSDTKELASKIFANVNALFERKVHQPGLGQLFFKDVKNMNELFREWKYAVKPLLYSFFGAFPETDKLVEDIDKSFYEKLGKVK